MFVTAVAAGGALCLLGAGAYLSPHALKLLQIGKLRRACSRSRTLVLSYDDGPGRSLTPAVLELLASQEARATFFLLGCSAASAPDLVGHIEAAGHELGCHGGTHRHAWRVWPWHSVRDIDSGYALLSPWTQPDAIYRPPCGKLVLPMLVALRRRRAPIGWWTIDSGDTRAVLPTPEAVVDAVRADGGGVVLLHDFDRDSRTRSERHAHVLRTTESLLRLAQSEGFRVRRLGEVLSELDGPAETRTEPGPSRVTRPAPHSAKLARSRDAR